MENASKALLIAGAILIVILLIGVGMMVFNGAQTSIEGSLDTMSAQEIQSFNSQFSSYEGTVKGSAARSLIQKIVASNGSNTYGRAVTLTVVQKSGSTSSLVTCANESDSSKMSTSAASITTTAQYVVSFGYNGDGTINNATITEK